MKYVIALSSFLLGSLATQPVFASDIEEIISEQAEIEMSLEMPEKGRFDVVVIGEVKDGAIAVQEFFYDRPTGRFVADVVFNDGKVSRLSGVATLMTEVPVPSRKIEPGEVISSTDITLTEIPWIRLGNFSVVEEDKIVGMQAKRLLAQGRPIADGSLTPPIVIKRGQKIDIVLRSGSMSISAPGKALSDAYAGQDIKVVNLVSNKTVLATAKESGIVEITQ